MMPNAFTSITQTFANFFESEKSGGVTLIICTIISLLIANSVLGAHYLHFWHIGIVGLSIEQWINDALMAIFFLLIGLELKRELQVGELSSIEKALLPAIAALGGVCLPALIHFLLNSGTETQAGVGIPMATDIAFALGVLALLGTRVPTSLKVFLAALAVIDDLAAIIVIAIFYTENISLFYLVSALSVFLILGALNRICRVSSLIPYLMGGILMWFFMLQSGIHATIAGVLLALTIPFSRADKGDSNGTISSGAHSLQSPSLRLENILHKPVAFIILPIFALANTGITIESDWTQALTSVNSLGIISGLIIGKPIGIFLFSFIAVMIGICKLPDDLNWRHIIGVGLLGGIGFTMSIFITNLAFSNHAHTIISSKIAILLASLIAGILGYVWLRFLVKPVALSTPSLNDHSLN